MAVHKIKATYSLETDVVRALERIAKRWQVTKSEAVSRAIRQAADSKGAVTEALAALDELQRLVSENDVDLDRWVEDVEAERKASDKRRTRGNPS